jgi:hypothetical protein
MRHLQGLPPITQPVDLLTLLLSYMLHSIIVGWLIRRTRDQIAQEKIMLIVELNLAGYQFTREIPDLRRKSLRTVRFDRRAMHWRIPHLRNPRAA